ncbi:hypothetical protein BD309DRAFT_974627 [Dichomitus squalens]|nr:hypothetical protein BD309DRAFT_974627 [Dichomitus squalens]
MDNGGTMGLSEIAVSNLVPLSGREMSTGICVWNWPLRLAHSLERVDQEGVRVPVFL